ncbi:hypothetical protein [Actinoplanes sp. NPDC051851]|uniref:mannitol dehydrogenase family protein n=1 Tax=Actinoplanes sp. NPDC051851 TaxID=3154753 RepID=UPI00341306A8
MPPLPVRILQVGAGAFIRAFVDAMVQSGNESGVLRHGIAVMKVTPRADEVIPALIGSGGRFTVVLDGVASENDTVQTVVSAYQDWNACLAVMREPDLEIIVSNTTEAGITLDLSADITEKPPRTFPALLTALLHERRRHHPDKSIFVLPCELNEDNGRTLRDYVLHHAADEPGLREWIAGNCRFYDTIVDRIVTKNEDPLVVSGEAYGSWAIAGDPAIREVFPLDRAGQPVEFMADIRPYRTKKVRILNGTHTALAAVAPLLRCTTVHEAVTHPVTGAFARNLLDGEILPTLEGAEPFAEATLKRFANPNLRHRLADISLNALAKWRTRNLPVVEDAWSAGREAPLSVFALACLVLAYAGRLDALPPRDDPAVIDRIRTGFDPADPLRGLDLPDRLTGEVSTHIDAIVRLGPSPALLQTFPQEHE